MLALSVLVAELMLVDLLFVGVVGRVWSCLVGWGVLLEGLWTAVGVRVLEIAGGCAYLIRNWRGTSLF